MSRFLVLLPLVVLALAACAPPVFTGCNSDGDCPVRCEEEPPFNEGLCTLTCDDNLDCPSGTLCIDIRDGLCLPACSSQDQCRAFDDDYACRDLEDTDGVVQLACLRR